MVDEAELTAHVSGELAAPPTSDVEVPHVLGCDIRSGVKSYVLHSGLLFVAAKLAVLIDQLAQVASKPDKSPSQQPAEKKTPKNQ
jgi:hypothetical protein